MVDILLIVYLWAPALLVFAAAIYALTRAADRLQLASLCLLACALLYAGGSYVLITRDPSMPVLGFVLGAYALLLYAAVAALAIYFNAWAWRVALAAFGLHLLGGLVSSPSALGQGSKGVAALLGYLLIGVVGLWATLHNGSRRVLSSGMQQKAT